jgi:hypothetical protein
VQGGFFLRKKPLGGRGFWVQQLENCCSGRERKMETLLQACRERIKSIKEFNNPPFISRKGRDMAMGRD